MIFPLYGTDFKLSFATSCLYLFDLSLGLDLGMFKSAMSVTKKKKINSDV